MDIVYVRDLVIMASIGVADFEKTKKQRVRIDLEMAWDNSAAAASDDLADALDYEKACNKITELVQSQHYELVERLAEEVAALLINEMGVPWLRVTLGKPDIIDSTSEVGTTIERGHLPK